MQVHLKEAGGAEAMKIILLCDTLITTAMVRQRKTGVR
jgi:hypothetical protein